MHGKKRLEEVMNHRNQGEGDKMGLMEGWLQPGSIFVSPRKNTTTCWFKHSGCGVHLAWSRGKLTFHLNTTEAEKIKAHLKESFASSHQQKQNLSPLGRYKPNLSGTTAKTCKGLKYVKAKIPCNHQSCSTHVAWELLSKKFGQVPPTRIGKLLLRREKNWTRLQIPHLCWTLSDKITILLNKAKFSEIP